MFSLLAAVKDYVTRLRRQVFFDLKKNVGYHILLDSANLKKRKQIITLMDQLVNIIP